MSINVRPLPPELQEKAKKELFEDHPKKLEESIIHIKEWIAKQPHLRARTDDQFLAAFIRGSKFSLERTKEKIDLTYTFKTLAPELLSLKPSDPKFMEILKQGPLIVLPKTINVIDPRVILTRTGVTEPGKYNVTEIMSVSRAIYMIMLLEDDQLVVNGTINLLDHKGATLAHFTSWDLSVMKKIMVAGQEATPIRMKGMHHVNMHPALDTLFNLGKSLMNDKNRGRVHAHGKDMESVYKHIPKEILPQEYGGSGGSIPEIIGYWVKKVEHYKNWFDEDDNFGTDESKRPGKPKTVEDTFGLEGSFRQLQVD